MRNESGNVRRPLRHVLCNDALLVNQEGDGGCEDAVFFRRFPPLLQHDAERQAKLLRLAPVLVAVAAPDEDNGQAAVPVDKYLILVTIGYNRLDLSQRNAVSRAADGSGEAVL